MHDKIYIIGPVGSGKTTLSELLSKKYNIKKYELDKIVWDDDTTLNLVSRRQMGFEASIILIVLRQILEDYDNNPIETQSADKIITNNEIKDEVRLFLSEKYDKAKLEKDLDTYIQRVADWGFLKEIKRNNDEVRYKIHRIIKEKVTLEDLDSFKKKLEEYANTTI